MDQIFIMQQIRNANVSLLSLLLLPWNWILKIYFFFTLFIHFKLSSRIFSHYDEINICENKNGESSKYHSVGKYIHIYIQSIRVQKG